MFYAVEGSPRLLELLEKAASTPQKADFIQTLQENLPTAIGTTDKQPDDLFALFKSQFRDFPNADIDFPATTVALNNRDLSVLERRNKKRQFISDIGLSWTADFKALFFSKVNPAFHLLEKSSFLL